MTIDELQYLLKNALDGTDEVPWNTPKDYLPKTSKHRNEEVVFEKFRLRTSLPNVCSLRDGRIMFCTKFEGSNTSSPDDIVISGIELRRSPYAYQEDSLHSDAVGFYKCETSDQCISVSAREVLAKCVAFPEISSTANLKTRKQGFNKKDLGGYNFFSHDDWFIVNMLG
jgi:hypothetical protein